jgi:hypothetical protein
VNSLKHTGDPGLTDCNITISPQDITANPDAPVTISYSGNVWSHPACPDCIDQVVIGLEDTPLLCAYNAVPGNYPGKTFSGILSFTAPKTSGTYRIFCMVTSQWDCEDAEYWYRQHPEQRIQIGTLRVGAPTPTAEAPTLALITTSIYKYKR